MPSGCRKKVQTEVPLGLDEKAMTKLARIGHGLLVWERSRLDKWGIWMKRLSGGAEKLLVPEEEGRDHFCPKLSPDGSLLAYMSYARGTHPYLSRKGLTGELCLMNLSTGRQLVLAEEARSYSEDRAVTWLNKREIAYIDGKGRTMRMHLSKGGKRQVINEAPDLFGYLPSPDLQHATSGTPEFAKLSKDGELTHQPELGGCQPYFTSDSRWGFWMRGAGGPITAMQLATRESKTIMMKDDPRLNTRRNYIYFPMVSPCMRLLAFAASADKHDHFEADYDLYVAPLNPRTMDLIGTPVRYTKFSGCDRFPDVFRKELALGTHFVEGETELRFRTPDGSEECRWRFDDGKEAMGRVVKHTFAQPGTYWIDSSRRSGTKELRYRGLVVVEPPMPPVVKRVNRVDDRTVEVIFSEEISASKAKVTVGPEDGVASLKRSRENMALIITLDHDLTADAFITLQGVKDQAQKPNTMPRTVLSIPGNSWPTTRNGLVFAWRDSLKTSPSTLAPRMQHRGLAFPDDKGAMKVRGGCFEASEPSVATMREAIQASGQMTLELVMTPQPAEGGLTEGQLLSLQAADSGDLLSLNQSGERIHAVIRTPSGESHSQLVGSVNNGRANHLFITVTEGELNVSTNSGERWNQVKIEGDLSQWQIAGLRFGAAADGSKPWRGLVERVAVYDRPLTRREIERHVQTTFAPVVSRQPTRRLSLKLKLLEASPLPALQEIQPYREGLVRNLYEVMDAAVNAHPKRAIVTQWAWMDGKAMPAQKLKVGDVLELPLEQIEAHTELDSLFVKDTLNTNFDEDQYYDVSDWDTILTRAEHPAD